MARPKIVRGSDTRDTILAAERPRRQGADARNLLSVNGLDKNRQYRWVNDSHGGQRILGMQQRGWRIETSTTLTVGDANAAEAAGEGAAHKRFVGSGADGQPMFAYLMSISKEMYDEDQEYKQRDIDEQEDAILYGPTNSDLYSAERGRETVRKDVRRSR